MQRKIFSPLRFWGSLFTAILLPVFIVNAQPTVTLWQLGLDDNSMADFHQENTQMDPPGSPSAVDNDYYFAGHYAAVGWVETNEIWGNFKRALTYGDYATRIHFNLSEAQAKAANSITLSFKMFSYNNDACCPTGAVPITATWNDTQVLSDTLLTDPQLEQATFTAGGVAAVAGENVVTIQRDITTGNAWVQFDYVKADVQLLDPASTLILSFNASPIHLFPGQTATLSWNVDPQATLTIDHGVGTVTADPVTGLGSVDVFPTTETLYTLTATKGGNTVHATARVVAAMINSFTATPANIRIDDQATLAWVTAPDASLVIDQGVGNVDAKTINGAGSVTVTPASDTTYNLTATRGALIEHASVTVTVNPLKLIWQLGYNDNQNGDFHQETTYNSPPGSPTALDMDYYFAGQYPDPIGTVASDEPWSNFQRALDWVDTTRIHFNLTEAQAAPLNNVYVTFKLFGFNTDPKFNNDPTAPVWASWNDTEILSRTDVADPTIERLGPFLAGDIGAVPGANTLTISRDAVSGNAWIQFDYLTAEVETTDPTAGLISWFRGAPADIHPGQSVTLSWKTDPLATLTIDQGVGNVSSHTVNGLGSIQLMPTSSTVYTLTSTRGAASIKATVHVTVALIDSFTASRTSIKKGESITLNWLVDPDVTVSLAPAVGGVNGLTTGGVGALALTPAATTTYILTVTKPGFSAQVSVTVVVDPYSRVWELGYEDNGQAEFGQEAGGVNPAPGSPTTKDNDYYFAGQYPDPIGLVATDEPWANFERALKPSEYLTRIHVNLTEAQAAPENIFRITFRLFGFNTDKTYNTDPVPWVTATWNDTLVLTNNNITDPTLEQAAFNASDVGAAVGDNTLTIQRSTDGNEWIQFDYIKLEYYNPSTRVWELGYADNSVADFHQEGGGVNPPPGSPTAIDNDYYFAGTYAALNPTVLQANEAWGDFERALKPSENLTRLHFNLSAAEAAADTRLRLTFKLFSFNNDPTYDTNSVPWLTAKWNDTVVLSNIDLTDPSIEQATFTAGQAGAVPGENTLTIERSLQGNEWIVFDYVKVEAEMADSGGLRITGSGPDAFGFTVPWKSVPGRSYQVLVSSDLKAWTTLADSYPQGGATDVLTTYTDTTANSGGAPRFYKVVDLSPNPLFSEGFESGAAGWEAIDLVFSDTLWELGTPVDGPGKAHSGANAYGTGLTSNYKPFTEIVLRSPLIDLTGITNALVRFWNYRDIGPTTDYGSLEIVDDIGDPLLLAPLWTKAGVTGGWRREQVALPPEALDRPIRLQFHFFSDDAGEGAGWFIDDVAILPQ